MDALSGFGSRAAPPGFNAWPNVFRGRGEPPRLERATSAPDSSPSSGSAPQSAQDIPAYRILLAVAAKETDYPLGLLKGSYYRVEQDAVEAPVAETNAVLVMLKKRVRDGLQRAQMPESLLHEQQPQIPWITAANRDIKGEALG